MKIKSYKTYSKEKLIKKLRKVILLDSEKIGKPIFVYKNAKIELTEVNIRELLPFQLYQLESSNQLVSNLYKIFKEKCNQDIFSMNGYVKYISNDKPYVFTPPIIEYIQNGKGKIQKIIIDGLHRIILAKKLKNKTITVVAIENIPHDLIVPAAPNSWRELIVVDRAPSIENKRKWLMPAQKGYLFYRNFQSVFQNIGKPRTSPILLFWSGTLTIWQFFQGSTFWILY